MKKTITTQEREKVSKRTMTKNKLKFDSKDTTDDDNSTMSSQDSGNYEEI